MSENGLTRFASGEIRGFNFARKNKGDKYGFAFEGFYEDTKDKVEGYFASKYPIKIFEGDDTPIDPSQAQDLKFKGRVMFSQKDYDGKQYLFPQAVSIEKRIEIMEKSEDEKELKGNPFLENPIK